MLTSDHRCERTRVNSSQPTLVKILATCDPRDRVWELPELPAAEGTASVALVGWVLSCPPVDAGVPAQVAEILAGALTTRYGLTFLDPTAAAGLPPPDRWSPAAAGWVRGLRSGERRRVLGAPVLPLLSTDRPDVAIRLFSAEGFSWDQRAQIVALTSSASEPPDLPYAFYDQWLRHRRLDAHAIANEKRVEGLLIPGPDGDFGGLLFLNPTARDQLLVTLSNQYGNANVEFAVVPEGEFRSTRWYRSK
jgi:hypothetical protein